MSLFDSTTNTMAAQYPVGIPGLSSGRPGNMLANATENLVINTAVGAVKGLYNANVSAANRQLIGQGGYAVANILNGDYTALGMQALKFLPNWTNAVYIATPTPLFGGISPSEAIEIYQRNISIQRSKKNLWLLQVQSNLLGDASEIFNLFATEVEYSPFTIDGEKIKIGSGNIDRVDGATSTEMRITTTDDTIGNLKRWFQAQVAVAVHQDGTVGVPFDYAIRIAIAHNFITEDSAELAKSKQMCFENIGWFRAVGIEISLSRRDNALEELSMSFTQLDSFVGV